MHRYESCRKEGRRTYGLLRKKRAFKILGHLGSDEAKELKKKRIAYKKAHSDKGQAA